MSSLLLQLIMRNNSQVITQWQDKRNKWIAAQQFVAHFGRQCTKTMAIRLKESSINHTDLKSIFSEYNTSKAFDDQL